MRRSFRIILKVFSGILILLVLVPVLLLIGPRLFGLTPYTVLSGSMEPTYHVGSVVYVAETIPSELKAQDPITYKIAGGTIVTHRIIEVLNEGNPSALAFRTCGDANQTPDGTPVPAAAIIGKPQFSIPYLGYIADFVKKPYGLAAVIALCGLEIFLSILTDLLFPKQGKKDKDDCSQPASQPETP